MDSEHSEILGEIIQDSRSLAELLRGKRWPEIVEYLASVDITVKGIPRDALYLGKFLMMWTAELQEPEIVVDELLDVQFEADRVGMTVRVAALGVRVQGGAPDGIIIDSRLVFVRHEGRWSAAKAAIECPPEWAQWKNRPNERAPIHYANPAWRQQRSETAGRSPRE